MHADIGLFHLAERTEDDLSRSITAVGPQVRQDDERGYCHTGERPHRIEGLRQIEPSRCCFLFSQREDKRIGCSFQKRQSEGKDVEGKTEKGETLIRGGRDEEEGADHIEGEPQEDTALVAEAVDEEGGRNGHCSITTIEGKLHERSLRCREFHHGLEGCDHRVGDVIGKAPEGEERGNEDKGNEVFPFDEDARLAFSFFYFHCGFRVEG
ncbi:hypothetical protein EVA_07451 [gut metagenome]|uniref:Uncharacterized protein n=1 Tax=gut metagenome TaxID=749906 RepID=J9GAU5_9ZZZZ